MGVHDKALNLLFRIVYELTNCSDVFSTAALCSSRRFRFSYICLFKCLGIFYGPKRIFGVTVGDLCVEINVTRFCIQTIKKV